VIPPIPIGPSPTQVPAAPPTAQPTEQPTYQPPPTATMCRSTNYC
jgi:hypothetical protein